MTNLKSLFAILRTLLKKPLRCGQYSKYKPHRHWGVNKRPEVQLHSALLRKSLHDFFPVYSPSHFIHSTAKYFRNLLPSNASTLKCKVACKVKVKVKVTLVQALRLCTGRTAHSGSRGIALLFLDQRHWKGVRGQRHALAALYPRERPGTHFTGGWVGPRTGLDRCGKISPPPGFDPWTVQPVAQSLYRLSYTGPLNSHK